MISENVKKILDTQPVYVTNEKMLSVMKYMGECIDELELEINKLKGVKE